MYQLHNDMFKSHIICISTSMHNIKTVMHQHFHLKHIAPLPNPPVSHLVCQPHDASVEGHRDWSFLQSHCAPGQLSDSNQCIQLGPKSIVSSEIHLRILSLVVHPH